MPLVGVLFIMLIRDDSEIGRRNIRNVALLTTVFNFVFSLYIWFAFDNSNYGFQMVEYAPWMGSGIAYHMGVDGISMLFIILTTFLMPLCILASWESVQKRVKDYMIAFLILGNAYDRRFLRARHRAVLRLLRSRTYPDVHHHRSVGWRAAGSMRASSSSSTRCSVRC